MTRLFSVVLGLALFAATTGCGMLSSPPTQREQTAGIGALGGGAAGAIIGSLTGSALAGGLVGLPLGALAGFYIGDQMSRSEMRREAERGAADKQLAELRDENERLRRQSAPGQEQKASSALASEQKPLQPTPDLPPSNVTIGFDFDRSTLNSTSHEALTPIVTWLKADSDRSARIVGYTDSIGSDAYNLKLSERRAQVVWQYLIQNGVRAGKVSARGMGETHPIAANDTEAGRQRNRRVEVILNGGVNTASGK